MPPAGVRGFEGLIAGILGAETGYRYYVARNGDQPSGDAYAPDMGVALQTKRMTASSIRENELEGDIDRVIREIPALEIYVIATSREFKEVRTDVSNAPFRDAPMWAIIDDPKSRRMWLRSKAARIDSPILPRPGSNFGISGCGRVIVLRLESAGLRSEANDDCDRIMLPRMFAWGTSGVDTPNNPSFRLFIVVTLNAVPNAATMPSRGPELDFRYWAAHAFSRKLSSRAIKRRCGAISKADVR